MQKFITVLVGLLLNCSICIALDRSYYCHAEFCKEHQPVSPRYTMLERYLPLFPTSSGTCWHTICSKCGNTCTANWIEESSLFEAELDKFDCEEEDCNYQNSDVVYEFLMCPCKEKSMYKDGLLSWWDSDLPTWKKCKCRSIYRGYFDEGYTKYFSFLLEYLHYIESNRDCTCFWPESSRKASLINKKACELFYDLFEYTRLKDVLNNKDLYASLFITQPHYSLTLEDVYRGCTCHSFLYSDYDWICRDLEFYSQNCFQLKDFALIKIKLDNIRFKLGILFLDLYEDCLTKHSSKHIQKEKRWSEVQLHLYHPEFSEISFMSSNFVDGKDAKIFLDKKAYNFSDEETSLFGNTDKDNNNLPARPFHWLESDLCVSQAVIFNDLQLYENAIKSLSEAIEYNPNNCTAYIERASAYFETNQIHLALEDYKKAEELRFRPPLLPHFQHNSLIEYGPVDYSSSSLEFSSGLVVGTTKGAEISARELLPALWGSCRGLCCGLWALVCSPKEVSIEMINAAYSIGEYINLYGPQECLEFIVPEIKELSLIWRNLSNYSKGEKIGYIIGKYGVDIFAPLGTMKGINKFGTLKTANTLCTLEACATSEVKLTKILKESSKRVLVRETLGKSLKKGQIIIRSSNVPYHVMQKKHAWDKILKLSGQVEEDFKKVGLLLEEHCILSEKHFLQSEKFAYGKIIRADYKMIINDFEVQAVFETHVEINQTFLKDAWVITKS